ncbi:MAG: helicase [Gemmatimonas sp.]|nr:helicase [Gemmatimonas sp.]
MATRIPIQIAPVNASSDGSQDADESTARVTLFDKLSRLTLAQAVKLLGSDGKRLLHAGGAYEVDLNEGVELTGDAFRVWFPDAQVEISLNPAAMYSLDWSCDACDRSCAHVGSVFSLILEEKLALGLSTTPPERVPIESLSDGELTAQMLAEREERARDEKMRLKSMNPDEIWTDYAVTNPASGKSYRVALRGWERGESYCSCPDFRKNTLGTCKHILHTLAKVRRRFPASKRSQPYERRGISVHLLHGGELQLRMALPARLPEAVAEIVAPLSERPITDLPDLLRRIRLLEREGVPVSVYPDAEEYIDHQLVMERIRSRAAEIRRDPNGHPLRTTLLHAELLPFQLDGIAFAAGAGRAILADDMGLGKTIQGIGLAELLAREAAIRRVLVICPASVKFQWKNEIRRFSDRSCQIVLGRADERASQYADGSFFTICNYEQVLRDILAIERVPWDLIILDEGQRIKNWEAKTSRIVKSLRSPFAVVLSGTPLENRLDDLFSVTEFVDYRRLGPAFRFFNRHRVTDEKGKVLGYRDLDVLRENLRPILLRRTRASVMRDLPARTTEIIRIPATDEQLAYDGAQMRIVSSIVRKRYISEMDLLRLQKALLLARMNANSTYLVDKQPPGYSTKLDHLSELLEELAQEEDRKVVLFSDWTTMLGLVETKLDDLGVSWVRLDGSVPQRKRQQLVDRFQRDASCTAFLATNAGATGLNLQAANTVINIDLPWNPAVLEQRIARVHRMGQQNPIQVYVLVTEGTIEEKLLATLSGKHELALAALDLDSEVTEVELASGMEELKRRLELLLGAKPNAATDESEKRRVDAEIERRNRQERVAEAGGQLLSAAFAFLGEMIPLVEESEATIQAANQVKGRLNECLERDQNGRPQLTVTLPDDTALENLTRSLASLLAAR